MPGCYFLSFKFNEEKLNEHFERTKCENEIRRMNVANNVSAIAKIEVRQKTV